MSDNDKTAVFRGEKGTIVADSRHMPIHIMVWIGSPSIEQVDLYFDHRAEMITASPTSVVCVHDLSQLQTPPATVRKYLGDRGGVEDAKLDKLARYYVVIPNALVRGVITAITWVGGSKIKPISYVSDMSEAFQKAMANLGELGVAPPTNLDIQNYVPPDQA